MHPLSSRLADHLPALRRYASAFTGSRERGDTLVCLCLEAALADADRLAAVPAIRLELFELLHRACGLLPAEARSSDPDAPPPGEPATLGEALQALGSDERAAVLLVSLERFTYRQAARILDLPPSRFSTALVNGRLQLALYRPARVLIVEDEAIVALDLKRMVTRMGHEVCGIAPSRSAALSQALRTKPTLMLADIRLQGGDDGIETAEEIHRHLGLPVVFVTAHGDALGRRRVNAARIVHKPFAEKTLETAIRSALNAAKEARRPLP